MASYANLIGSIGVALLLVAFVLNLAKRLPSSAATYTVLNFVGAGLAFKDIGNKHPEATIPLESTFWDEMLDVVVQIALAFAR